MQEYWLINWINILVIDDLLVMHLRCNIINLIFHLKISPKYNYIVINDFKLYIIPHWSDFQLSITFKNFKDSDKLRFFELKVPCMYSLFLCCNKYTLKFGNKTIPLSKTLIEWNYDERIFANYILLIIISQNKRKHIKNFDMF